MTEKITQLKKQIEAGKFPEVFDYLDLYFEENPHNQYSIIKMNILHQINMGFAPNPMQVQGLQLFLNSSKIKEIVPIIEQGHKNTTPQTTETMNYGIEKEIEGLRKPLEILIEKKNGFEEAISKTVDFEIKNSYKLRLKDTEQEIEELRQKVQKLKGENPSNSELKELDNKTQKAQEEIKQSLKDNLTSVSILYIAALPADKGSLRSEFDDIAKKLYNSVKNKEVEIFLPSWETDYNALLTHLKNYKPTILHYSGHGNKNGLALMNKTTGLTQELENDELEEIFENRNEYLKLVFLNSCFSSHQAKIISSFGMYVLGINDQEVADELAIKLAESFYLGISAQDAPISLEKAIKIGCRNFVKSYNQENYISLWKEGKEISYKSL